MLVSWGNFDETTRISAKVCYKQVSSMKLSYFLESVLQQSYMHIFSLQWPKLPRCENTKKSRTDGGFDGQTMYIILKSA